MAYHHLESGISFTVDVQQETKYPLDYLKVEQRWFAFSTRRLSHEAELCMEVYRDNDPHRYCSNWLGQQRLPFPFPNWVYSVTVPMYELKHGTIKVETVTTLRYLTLLQT